MAGLRAGLDQVNPKLSQLVQDALDAGLPEILPALEARLESLRRGANPENAVAAFAKAAAELGEHYPVLAAIKAGTAHPLEIARALKQGLQLDGQVSSTGPGVRGKSLARLSDDAFARVESGEIAPDLAQAVADRVGDKDLHSGLFDDLKKAGADTPERAREILPDLLPHPGTGPTDVLLGVRRGDMPDFDSLITDNIEDPMGPQAKKQTERMAQDLAPEIAEAQALGPARPMTATPEDVAAGAAGVRDAIADVAGTPRLAGEITRTTDLPGYGTPEFEARRAFNFPGETVVGYAAAEQKLFEHASWFAGGPVAHDRQIIVLLGPPGSGKSTIAKPLAKATKSAYISADDAKAVLPEYDGGKNAQGVHSESTKITDGVTNRALASGANFIIEKLGRNAASIERHVQEWKQRGYTVKVVAVSAERGELAARIESRAAQDGRVIDLSIVDQTLNALPEVLDRARKSADFAGVMEVDNSGSAPKIISGKDLFGHDARRAIEDGAALRQPGMVLLDRGSIDRAADRSQQGLAGREGGAGHGQDAARITLDDSLRDMAGTILPPGTAVKTFSSIDELPKGLRDEVIAGNAHVLAAAERRFRTAKTDAARDAARLVLDDAKAGRGIEGIAHDGVIYIATYALDPRGRLAHEAVHWLKEAGKLTPGEISILAARARETGVFGPERAALYRQELKSRGFSSGRVAETVPRTRGAEPIMRL